jgi:hypothetical protein
MMEHAFAINLRRPSNLQFITNIVISCSSEMLILYKVLLTEDRHHDKSRQFLNRKKRLVGLCVKSFMRISEMRQVAKQ